MYGLRSSSARIHPGIAVATISRRPYHAAGDDDKAPFGAIRTEPVELRTPRAPRTCYARVMATQTAGDGLQGFIRTAKTKDVSDQTLIGLLRQNGWSERRIYRELGAYYADALGQPLPSRPRGSESANQAFLYLLNFITLAIWVTELGAIFCAAIARWVPDATHPFEAMLLQFVPWQLAAVLVAFPCFLVVARLIAREVEHRPESAESGVRLWLTYIALVIAGLVALGDSIWVVGGFLNGELTTQFVLNSVVVIGLSGGVFAYYLTTLRAAGGTIRRDRIAVVAAVLLVVAGVACALVLAGSPARARARALDARRAADITAIAGAIRDRYTVGDRPRPLPRTLPNDLRVQRDDGSDAMRDPVTDAPYRYVGESANRFRLCATFSVADDSPPDYRAAPHPAGNACYRFDATSASYRPERAVPER